MEAIISGIFSSVNVTPQPINFMCNFSHESIQQLQDNFSLNFVLLFACNLQQLLKLQNVLQNYQLKIYFIFLKSGLVRLVAHKIVIVNNYSPKWRWIVMDIYQAASAR